MGIFIFFFGMCLISTFPIVLLMLILGRGN